MYSSRSSAHSSSASRKQHNDRNQQILKALLKEAANKNCADCKTASHPRWASWNLGCFICIRCSGIHRSMGTHISRVKSVDLDSWTDEQIKAIVSWGNAKANAFWEHRLPSNYVPDDSKIENFIRTKYERKKWAKSSSVPDPSTIVVSASSESHTLPPETSAQSHVLPAQDKPVPALPQKDLKNENNLLDFDFGSSTSSINSVVSQPTGSTTQSAPNLQHTLLSGGPPKTQGGQVQQPVSSRPDLKKSILSLYSTPTSSTPNFQQQQQQRQAEMQSFHSIVNSATTVQQAQQRAQQVSATPTATQSHQQFGANPWATSSSTSNSSTNNALNDDVFKNVWS